MAPVAATSNINGGNANNKLHQVQQSNSDISCMLFLHREELRKKKPSFMSKAYTRLQLTHGLITKTVRNVAKFSRDDLDNIKREIVFKNKLRKQISRVKHYRAEKHQKQLKQQHEKYLLQQQQKPLLLPLQEQKQTFPIQQQNQPLPIQQEQQHLPLQQNPSETTEFSAKVNKLRRRLF